MEKKNKWLQTENILLLVFVVHAVVSFAVVCLKLSKDSMDYSILAWTIALAYAILKGTLDTFKSHEISSQKSLEFEKKIRDLKTKTENLDTAMRNAKMKGQI